jgi:hypothetical protein
MSLFGIRNLIAVSVAVSSVAVAVSTMSMVVEEEQSHDVRRQSQTSYNQDKLRLGDLLRLHEALDGLEEDAHAQRHEEDTVDQRTQCLRALPSICVRFGVCLGVGDLDGPETDAEGEDIVEHVEGIGDQGEGVDGISDGEFEEEEEGVDDQEDDDLGGLGEGHGDELWWPGRLL